MLARLHSYRLIVKAKSVLYSGITVAVATRILRRLLDANMMEIVENLAFLCDTH